MFAGAPALLATLWEVDEEPTRSFMEKSYRHYTSGNTKPESLRLTQNKFRNAPDEAPLLLGGVCPLQRLAIDMRNARANRGEKKMRTYKTKMVVLSLVAILNALGCATDRTSYQSTPDASGTVVSRQPQTRDTAPGHAQSVNGPQPSEPESEAAVPDPGKADSQSRHAPFDTPLLEYNDMLIGLAPLSRGTQIDYQKHTASLKQAFLEHLDSSPTAVRPSTSLTIGIGITWIGAGRMGYGAVCILRELSSGNVIRRFQVESEASWTSKNVEPNDVQSVIDEAESRAFNLLVHKIVAELARE